MCSREFLGTIGFLCLLCVSNGFKSPPRVEDKPLLLDSYVPAAMQVIAHLTELMKYELRPGGTTTTTTTVRPTPSHKPGIFSPELPPGPEAYFARKNSFSEGSTFFDRFRFPLEDQAEGRSSSWVPSSDELKSIEDIFEQLRWDKTAVLRKEKELGIPDLDLLGKEFDSIFNEANRLEEDDSLVDEDTRAENFLKNYDSSSYSLQLLKQKRIPPTRAYVSLLSLYDFMNKDAKKLGLNKFGGYSDEVLKVLIGTSSGSSADQLKTVFTKVVERKDTNDAEVLKRINLMLTDMGTEKSYLNDALRYIPPLQFAV